MDFRDPEKRRSFQLNMLIGLAGFAYLLVFGFNALLDGQMPLATALLLTASAGMLSLMAMWWTSEPSYGAFGISVAAAFMFMYLLITGGTDGTGPLWCYPLVAIIAFLQGLRRGLYAVVGLTVAASAIFFMPQLPIDVAEYTASFKTRFLFSFVALAIMALIYEHLRGQSQTTYEELSDKLDRASRTDDLTGLANRREIRELLDAEASIYARYGHAFSVIMADLDRFKELNDRHGHAVGDKYLIAVADCFKRNVRELDRVARWGGEEFVILLPQTRLPEAQVVAEKLRKAVAQIASDQGKPIDILTASFGVQSIEHAANIDDLIRQADDRLYEAKHRGRNQVVASEQPVVSDKTVA